MRRILPLLAVVALLAAACGGGEATDAGPVPERPSTTVEGEVDGGAPTTTTPAGSGATTTAPPAAAGTTEVMLWFARGETIESVTRAVPRVPRIGAEAVKALLSGPTTAETRAGYTTAIPGDTRFRDLVIDGNGIATVDLSRDFEAGGGTLGLTLRLAQVTCTVGQFPTVRGVRFALAGEVVNVFSGNGIVLDRPVTCDSYGQYVRRSGGPAAFAGIWPFTTRAELDAYAAGSARTYLDPLATAREFATKYIGMDDPVDFGFRSTGAGAGEVAMGFRFGEGRTPVPNPQPTFTVALRQLGASPGSGPWSVVGATSPNIVVATPRPLDRAASPVRLTGQAHVFEGTVGVEVREDGMVAGQSLGRGFVTGGGDTLRPFSGEVAFRGPSKPAGAIVFMERSAADGQSILRAAVVRVRF
jgi:hypothetical protein